MAVSNEYVNFIREHGQAVGGGARISSNRIFIKHQNLKELNVVAPPS
jgi:hypothetical protein